MPRDVQSLKSIHYWNNNYVSGDSREVFQKNREETMEGGLNGVGSVGGDSDFHSSGLIRYRSAPSSLLANFNNEDQDFLPRSSSTETENMFARLISCDSSCLTSESRDLQSMEGKSSSIKEEEIKNSHGLMSVMMGNEAELVQQMMYHQQNHSSSATDGSSYRMSPLQQMDSHVKNSNGSVSSLTRHSSSPAGFFSENGGYSMIRGTSRLKNEMSFSRQASSTTGLMSQISEIGSESMGASSSDDGSLGNGGRCFIPGFPVASWDETDIENFTEMHLQNAELSVSARKRFRDINGKMLSGFNSLESQNGEIGNHVPSLGLTHHFSLPKPSAQLVAMEKLLQLQNSVQLQDSVPCKIRAKRGHATHPRSIAERVRRTRISERIRKLQELVPNMDKQTNTADMLDLAVEYIKELQNHVKTLSDDRATCTCSCKMKT